MRVGPITPSAPTISPARRYGAATMDSSGSEKPLSLPMKMVSSSAASVRSSTCSRRSFSSRARQSASVLDEPALARDLSKMRALFRALEEKERLLHVLDRTLAAEELTIFIGKESGFSEPELSIVAAPYRRAGEIVGALGVIGPTRMDYSRVIPLVEFTARAIGLALDPTEG